MFAFKEEYPVSAMVSMADIVVPFYQPIIGQDRQVKGYEVLARRWDAGSQGYQGIDFAALGENDALHLDIVMLRAIMRDLPVLAQKGPYALSINLNPALSSPTYRNLLLLVLLQARKLGIAIWFEVLEQAPEGSLERKLALHLLPLPVDQRCGPQDMERIARIVEAFYS